MELPHLEMALLAVDQPPTPTAKVLPTSDLVPVKCSHIGKTSFYPNLAAALPQAIIQQNILTSYSPLFKFSTWLNRELTTPGLNLLGNDAL